jgi:hypothetical protein
LADAPADLRLDGLAQLRPHRADDILRGGAGFAFDRQDPDGGRREFRLILFRSLMTAGEKKELPRRKLKAVGVSWSKTTLSRTARAADTKLFQHNFQRTEIGERRLQQVEADKRGEPKPIRAVVIRQQQADEDEGAGEPVDGHVHFHTHIPSRQLRKSYKPIAGIVFF